MDVAALFPLAEDVAELLVQGGWQLVLAESCTAGLVAALLGGVPGISRNLCGSAVVYQEAVKTAWLGVSTRLLEDHGAVSAEVAAAMSAGALRSTPAANLAVAITGHLGPNAPAEQDGLLFVSIQYAGQPPHVQSFQLAELSQTVAPSLTRRQRQATAAQTVLSTLRESLRRTAASHGG